MLEIPQLIELFDENVLAVNARFSQKNIMQRYLTAYLYTAHEQKIDADQIKRNMRLIKDNTKAMSPFRANACMNLAVLLAFEEDADASLTATVAAYEALYAACFTASDYLPIAAFMLARMGQPDDFSDAAQRAYQFYEGLKKNRFLLTGSDDVVFAAQLGALQIPPEMGVSRVEELFVQLRPGMQSGRGVQAASQMLMLAAASASRTLALDKRFTELGLKFGSDYLPSSLAALSLTRGKPEQAAQEVFDIYERLEQSRGLGSMMLSRVNRLLLAAMLGCARFGHIIDEHESIALAQQETVCTAVMQR